MVRASDSGARGRGFNPHSGHRVVSLSKTNLPPKSTGIIALKALGRDCTNNNELFHKIGVVIMQLFSLLYLKHSIQHQWCFAM